MLAGPQLRVQTNRFNVIPPSVGLMLRKTCIRALFIFSGVSGEEEQLKPSWNKNISSQDEG